MRIIDNKILNTQYKVGYGFANGTFGELLQGVLSNKKSFMVTFPINLFSYATFIPKINTNDITVFPNHKIKSLSFAKSLLGIFNIKIGGQLIIQSEILEGKGLASSSADLVATAYAISNSLKVPISKELISRLIQPIEPSDGVMYPGVVSFYYKELELIESIGNLPSLVIIGIDEGGMIDTVKYNSKLKYFAEVDTIKYQNMLINISNAIRNRDLVTVGKISTESAIMNQQYNPKKFLNDLISVCKNIGGIGVSAAHSGTFVGILLDQSSVNFVWQKLLCLNKLKKISNNVSIFYSLGFNENSNIYKLSRCIERFNNVDTKTA
ncbi:MAG: kinase [Alphaproteobacteria bacterium]